MSHQQIGDNQAEMIGDWDALYILNIIGENPEDRVTEDQLDALEDEGVFWRAYDDVISQYEGDLFTRESGAYKLTERGEEVLDDTPEGQVGDTLKYMKNVYDDFEWP